MQKRLDTTQQALFTDAYRQYSQELHRRSHSMIGDRELCEDIVQDVFVRMWLYMIRGGKIDNARAFLHRVLSNIVVDTYRKRKTVSLEDILRSGYEPSIDDTERWVDIIDGRKAFKLINRLPATYRTVLKDIYAYNLSCGEISLLKGVSKNTISVQLHRGLAKLKCLYNGIYTT